MWRSSKERRSPRRSIWKNEAREMPERQGISIMKQAFRTLIHVQSHISLHPSTKTSTLHETYKKIKHCVTTTKTQLISVNRYYRNQGFFFSPKGKAKDTKKENRRKRVRKKN